MPIETIKTKLFLTLFLCIFVSISIPIQKSHRRIEMVRRLLVSMTLLVISDSVIYLPFPRFEHVL